ncbi:MULTISPECIES: serine/threonine-protein kinase [unclassified Streptomyces]|uniref:serine/threonine-protein kinase n=2 Tax=unclassified Streptomyces TaxID=2593676 RepID=UPI001EF01A04|nr:MULTISPECIES: serine/threonine-protein kinase [unclassified Streptomyces]
MGEVWEAQDEKLDRRVAVKLISLLAGGGSRGREARARFLREARLTARLQHSHIVTVHDLGESGPETGNAPFLVMELVRGEGLDAKLERGAIDPQDAARWGAEIGEALAEAHAAGVLHRDIKPSNIFITHTGTVKVLDFGVARAADPYATADRLTQTGFIVGTPPYMAPEQARGHPEPGSDLYALGCLLFELLTARLPFQAPDSIGYLTAHLTDEPPAPSSIRPGLPSSWDTLVLKLLSKDPSERHTTAADASRALRRLAAAAPTKVLPPPRDAPRRPPPTAAKHTPVGGPWLPGGVWLLTVVATAILVSVNIDGHGDDGDAASGALVVGLATAWLVGHFVVMSRPAWRTTVTKVTRFALPLLLLAVYAVAVTSNAEDPWPHGPYWVAMSISTAALTSLLAFSAALTDRTGHGLRRAGYTLAALNTIAVLDTVFQQTGIAVTVSPHITFVAPQPVSAGVAVLAVAVYCVREIATRRAAPDAQRFSQTEVS